VSNPPGSGGDFQGIRVYRSDGLFEERESGPPRSRHRFDEPARLSLGMVASLQSQLPFHMARSLQLVRSLSRGNSFRRRHPCSSLIVRAARISSSRSASRSAGVTYPMALCRRTVL
jgi:hypothetical protein